jgi:hypothetical protein
VKSIGKSLFREAAAADDEDEADAATAAAAAAVAISDEDKDEEVLVEDDEDDDEQEDSDDDDDEVDESEDIDGVLVFTDDLNNFNSLRSSLLKVPIVEIESLSPGVSASTFKFREDEGLLTSNSDLSFLFFLVCFFSNCTC